MAIHYDPSAPDKGSAGKGEYEFERKFNEGEHRVVVLFGQDKKSSKGEDMIVLTLGFKGPEGGVKVDHRITDGSKWLKEAVQAFLPDFKGGPLSGKMFKDKVALADIAGRQWDSDKYGSKWVPDVKGLRALPAGQAQQQAPPAQPAPAQTRQAPPASSQFGDA